MNKLEKRIRDMKQAPQNVRFVDLALLCQHYFGDPRNKGTSHHVYKTPWPGNPRVNIQMGKGGKAKIYQVKQVLMAIEKMEKM